MELGGWDIMAPAFFECLVLVGIHSYLGIHVIRRKVIFVDLALAQIAALGTTVGFLFGILPDTSGAYFFSLCFTFLGAAIFSISRLRHEKIPQEAVIGLTYAIAASVAILVIDKAPHGAEHLKQIMTGSILWVKWSTIANAAIVYSLIGIGHFIFRRQFLLISENPEEAYRQGMSVRFWDFLFYVSFGIVITHSVGTAGVLLVFVFLVVPAIASILITDVLWKQLVIGWSLGLVVSVLGLYISYITDLPSGPTVVAFYGIMLTIIALSVYVSRSAVKITSLLKIGLGIVSCLIVIALFMLMGQFFESTYHEHEHQDAISEEEHLLHEVKEHDRLATMTENELEIFLRQYDNDKLLHNMFDAEDDPFIRFTITKRLLEVDRNEGLLLLVHLLESCKIPYLAEQIVQILRSESGQNFGFESSILGQENQTAVQKWKQWIRQ